MKKRILIVSATALFLVVGGASFAQEQQEEITDGLCPVSKVTLCYTDSAGVKTCRTETVFGPCPDGEEPAAPPANPNP